MADTNLGTINAKVKVAIEAFVKSGIKTTEFWSLILATLTIVGSEYFDLMTEQPWAPIAIASMFIVYAVSRLWMKLEAMKKVNIIPDAWEPKINEVLDVVKNLIETKNNPDPVDAPSDSEPESASTEEPYSRTTNQT